MTWAKIHSRSRHHQDRRYATRAWAQSLGEVVPQIWTYEHTSRAPARRAFVYMEGHTYANFDNPQIKNLLLRGIGGGNKPVETLASYVPPPVAVAVVVAADGGRASASRRWWWRSGCRSVSLL